MVRGEQADNGAGGSVTLMQRPGPMPGDPAEEAVARLLESHGAKLYTLASRLCGNAADAQDMVQEVFLQAFRKWGMFTGRAGSSASTWLYAIAARSCKARMRRKGGIDRRMPAVSQLMPFRDQRVVEGADRAGGPVSEVIGRESARAVQAAILTLPESFRVPLILKEMLELPLERVGEALGIKPETVKTRVHRARLLLRKAIVTGRGMPKLPAPAPTYERRVCLDLLKAKMDAMDRGRGFPIGQEVVCERCRAVFAELDLAQNACAGLADGKMPERVRKAIERALRDEEHNSEGVRPGGAGPRVRARRRA